MKFIAFLAALATSGILLTSCGSGGGAGVDVSPPTRRPKTMDGILVTVANGGSFEFIRNFSSPPALLSGDIETGTFIYTYFGTNWITPSLENFIGDRTDVQFPNFLSVASYQYRAVNENQGVLTLTATSSLLLPVTGRFSANNGSFMQLFTSDSNGFPNNQVELDVSFTSNGTTISANVATMAIPGSTSPYDRVRSPVIFRLVNGAPIPENYNPDLDPLRPSKIAPVSLNNKVISFTNTGFGDPNYDFTVEFVADAEGIPGNPPTEVGTGLQRIAGSVIDDAVNYTYQRINGTDKATLVISNGGNTFDGRYTLDFIAFDQGTYLGEVDAGTPDVNEVIGTFVVD
jgi:hypothetical protein